MCPAFLLALLLSAVLTDGVSAHHRHLVRNLDFISVPLPVSRPADLDQRQGPPLPPPRPTDLASAPAPRPPPPAAINASPTPAPFVPAPDPTCPAVLKSKEIVVAAAAPVSGPNGCGIATPVTLSAVVLTDGTKVPFEPPSLIRCDLAETLGAWFREDVAPALKASGGLARILGSNGYECRNRDHLAKAKLSEHAKGNALDLRGFVLRNGQTVLIEKDARQPAFLTRVRATACTRFRTVLGPGGDVFHETHLHVDLEQRHHDFRICEWNVTPPAFGPKMPVQDPKMPKLGSGIDVHGRHT